MIVLISLFYASIFGIVLMLLLKRKEIHSGNQSVISRIGSGADHFFHRIFSNIHRFISYINKHTFIALAQWIAFHVLLRIRKLYVEVKHRAITNPHGKRMIDAVRGRGEVRSHGASFYLRRISQDKGKQ
jgi:hypothetical protein